jgi:hypothetical protein
VDDAPAALAAAIEELGLEGDRRSAREWTVAVPSAKRGALAVALICNERTLTLQSFVIRAPDRNHEQVYRRLLTKGLGMYAWRFGLDRDGDVFAAAQVDLAHVDVDALDRLLGLLATYVDEVYEGVMRTGFDVPDGTVIAAPHEPG